MSPEVLRILLDAGADVNADSSLGTPLYMVLIFDECSPETVAFLISEGADVNFRTFDGQTPLMRAAGAGTSPEIIRFLLEAGANPNAQQEEGWTPLMLAALSGIVASRSHPDARHNISLLLKAGADPNIVAKSNGGDPSFTALSVAAWGNDREAAKLLLEAGADPNLKDSNGNTAFVTASRMLSGDVANLLLFGGNAWAQAAFWGLYAFMAALPFVVLKGNASRLFVKGKNIRKYQAWGAISEIILILVMESAPFWSSFFFKNNRGYYSPDVRRSAPLVARMVVLLPETLNQLYFLLVEQKKIAFLGETPQKRPFLHIIALVLTMMLCTYALLRSAGLPLGF
jgi:ankyrin repeat protein